jgi:hypothetical protein
LYLTVISGNNKIETKNNFKHNRCKMEYPKLYNRYKWFKYIFATIYIICAAAYFIVFFENKYSTKSISLSFYVDFPFSYDKDIIYNSTVIGQRSVDMFSYENSDQEADIYPRLLQQWFGTWFTVGFIIPVAIHTLKELFGSWYIPNAQRKYNQQLSSTNMNKKLQQFFKMNMLKMGFSIIIFMFILVSFCVVLTNFYSLPISQYHIDSISPEYTSQYRIVGFCDVNEQILQIINKQTNQYHCADVALNDANNQNHNCLSNRKE